MGNIPSHVVKEEELTDLDLQKGVSQIESGGC